MPNLSHKRTIRQFYWQFWLREYWSFPALPAAKIWLIVVQNLITFTFQSRCNNFINFLTPAYSHSTFVLFKLLCLSWFQTFTSGMEPLLGIVTVYHVQLLTCVPTIAMLSLLPVLLTYYRNLSTPFWEI